MKIEVAGVAECGVFCVGRSQKLQEPELQKWFGRREEPELNEMSGFEGDEPELNGKGGLEEAEPELNSLVKCEEETIFAAQNLGFPSFPMIKERKPAEKGKKLGKSKGCEKGNIKK